MAFGCVVVVLLHHAPDVPGVRRLRLDGAALSVGIEWVEGERLLAWAGQAGDHDQPVARQVVVDVLQVVGTGSADADGVHRHRGWGPWKRGRRPAEGARPNRGA